MVINHTRLVEPNLIKFHSIFSINNQLNKESRREVVNYTKGVLANANTLAQERLENGTYRGTECSEALSILYDNIISEYYNYLINNFSTSYNTTDSEKIVLVATGGYGRKRLAPGSDIDLLFLIPYKKTAWSEILIENMLYFLWDLGLKIGQATRTISECLSHAINDQVIATSLLDARYICGDKEIFNLFQLRFRKKLSKISSNNFVQAKLDERDRRHEKEGHSRYLVEPNVKNGKGGLRDLESLSWMTNFCYGVSNPLQMRDLDILTSEEASSFLRCEEFLWHVRCQLHFLEKKPQEIINFNSQMEMAKRLGYRERKGLQPVESFMKHYFLIAKEVGDLTRSVCSVLEEREIKKPKVYSRLINILNSPKDFFAITSERGFYVSNGRLNIRDAKVFKKDPLKFISFFYFLSTQDLLAHPNAIRLIRRSLRDIDYRLRNNKNANNLFIEILTSQRAEYTLRAMNEAGVLGKFLPDFGKIVGLMQFNMYHHYTADEHLLKAVGELNNILNSDSEDFSLIGEILAGGVNKKILALAIFFHDIAKGREKDHSEEGESIIRKMSRRLDLDDNEEETIAWLVLDHLKMSDFAQKRDLQDPKTISDFSKIVKTTERLKLLLILTVADIRAVGPGVWNNWKAELLKNLFNETFLSLTGQISDETRINNIKLAKEKLSSSLNGLEKERINRWIENQSNEYWLSTTEETRLRSAKLFMSSEDEVIINFFNSKKAPNTEMTIISRNRTELFKRITAACADLRINIVDARIFTDKENKILDILWIQDNNHKPINDETRLGRLSARIIKFINEKDTLITESKFSLDKRIEAFNVTPFVDIKNDLSEKYSVIEVSGKDRPGLLYELATIISDLKLNIYSAHISTFGEQASDVFYVLNYDGSKILQNRLNKKIKNSLIKVFSEDANGSK
ncbi:MAG: [protein-PII] uridylyltransferase [Pseudomonadota bacterium]|nr:[protein-PII] uridylyltransferase [Pseudomonadota bacterium]